MSFLSGVLIFVILLFAGDFCCFTEVHCMGHGFCVFLSFWWCGVDFSSLRGKFLKTKPPKLLENTPKPLENTRKPQENIRKPLENTNTQKLLENHEHHWKTMKNCFLCLRSWRVGALVLLEALGVLAIGEVRSLLGFASWERVKTPCLHDPKKPLFI